jgi:hypothetical protein
MIKLSYSHNIYQMSEEKYYHYIVFDVPYDDLTKTLTDREINVFKYSPGVSKNDHCIAFQTTVEKKKQIDQLDPMKWIQTEKSYQWYVNNSKSYVEIVAGHTKYTKYNTMKKCIIS